MLKTISCYCCYYYCLLNRVFMVRIVAPFVEKAECVDVDTYISIVCMCLCLCSAEECCCWLNHIGSIIRSTYTYSAVPTYSYSRIRCLQLNAWLLFSFFCTRFVHQSVYAVRFESLLSMDMVEFFSTTLTSFAFECLLLLVKRNPNDCRSYITACKFSISITLIRITLLTFLHFS